MIYRLNSSYYVRGLELNDINGPYVKWFSDQEVCKYNSHGKFPKDVKSFEKYVNEANNQNNLIWAICSKNNTHIGNISLQSINLINRNAEFAIIIGDKKHWGKGIGYLAATKLFMHGFNKINLHRIYCGCASNNAGMIKLAKKLRMKEEGCRRSQIYLENNWHDVIEFGILKEEFSIDNN